MQGTLQRWRLGGDDRNSQLLASYYFRTCVELAQGPFISQSVAATVRPDHAGASLTTIPITGNGLTDNWTGPFTNINEIVYNDSTFIYSGTAAQISNYLQATVVSDPVAAVVVTARAKTSSGAPQNLQLDINVGATDYFSSSFLQTAGYGASVNVWETNPATSAPWTAAAVNAPLFRRQRASRKAHPMATQKRAYVEFNLNKLKILETPVKLNSDTFKVALCLPRRRRSITAFAGTS